MIPLIEAKVVDERQWISREELLDLMAVAQSCPGIFAVNIAIFIGYKIRGTWGALMATLGCILPSFLLVPYNPEEIVDELMQSQAELLVLLGDIPIEQFLRRVSDVPYRTLQEYVDLYGYGNPSDAVIHGRHIRVLPFAHPRQIGALGAHSERWHKAHEEWEQKTER